MATVYLFDLSAFRGGSTDAPHPPRDHGRDGYAPIGDSADTPEAIIISTEPVGLEAGAPSSSDMPASSSSSSLPGGVSPAWTVALELLRWESTSLVATAWRDACRAHELQAAHTALGSSSSSNSSSSTYALLSVPEPLCIVNKYFRVTARLVVGCGITTVPDSVGKTPSDLPWHVFSGGRMSGALFQAVLVCDGDDDDGGQQNTGHTAGRADRKDETHDSGDVWYNECLQHGFEYISHDATGVDALERIDEDVEHAGLLGPTLHGSARLLQLLHNVLWPVGVRTPVSVAGAGIKASHSDGPDSLLVVATAEGQAALMARLSCTREEAKDEEEEAAHSSSRGASRPARSRYHRRFFTDVISAPAGATVAETASACEGFTGPSGLRLLLANRYQTSLVGFETLHPAFCSPENFEVTQRMLELRRERCYGETRPEGNLNDGDDDSDGELTDTAIVVWPPDGVSAADTTLLDPPLHFILDALLENGVGNTIVVTFESAHTRQKEAAWNALCCAERGVEMITLTDGAARGTRDTCADENDDDGPRGIDRLREVLHCAHWPPVRVTRVLETEVETSKLNGVQVCACAADHGGTRVGGFATALTEESWLRAFHRDVLVPVSTNGPAVALSPEEQTVLAKAPSLILPSLQFHVGNRYFGASLALTVSGGLHTALNPTSRAVVEAGSAVVIWTNAETVLKASQCTGEVDTSTAHGRLAHLLRALQKRLAAEEEAQLQRWTADDGPGNDIRAEQDETLALLYISDVPADAEARVDDVEAALTRLLSHNVQQRDSASKEGANNNSNSISDGDQDDQDDPVYPLFERVWAMPARPDTSAALHEDQASTHSIERLREALSQHVWRYRTDHSQHPQSPHDESGDKNEADKVTDKAAADLPNAPVVVEADKDAVEDTVAVIGCELPPDFLIDPTTLRSVRVHALSVSSRTVPSEGASAGGAAAEIHMWVEKMGQYGAKLPRAVRQHQASVLALAMEPFL